MTAPTRTGFIRTHQSRAPFKNSQRPGSVRPDRKNQHCLFEAPKNPVATEPSRTERKTHGARLRHKKNTLCFVVHKYVDIVQTRFESRRNYPNRNLQMHKHNPDGILNPQPRLIQGSNPRQTQKSPEQIARGFKYTTDLRFGRSNPGATELVGAEVPPAPNARSASASPARPGPT